jgi:hypothetical protein
VTRYFHFFLSPFRGSIKTIIAALLSLMQGLI